MQQKDRYEQALKQKTDELNAAEKTDGGSKAVVDFNLITNEYETNKDEVLKMLIGNIMNVNIEIPRVVKGNFES